MKKIMFDDHYGLEKAVLEGRKTMTRRIVPERLQSTFDACSKGVLIIPVSVIPEDVSIEEFAEQWRAHQGQARVVPVKDEPDIQYVDAPSMVMDYSKFQKGEVVAIAQAYKDLRFVVPHGADPQEYNRRFTRCCDSAGWKNKMFVAADLMPHRIMITDIRVERLQNISDEDCLKEGIYKGQFGTYTFKGRPLDIFFDNPRDAFACLINKISGKDTWKKNPWVFAYTFELVK